MPLARRLQAAARNTPGAPPGLVFGVLAAQETYRAADYTGGVRACLYALHWGSWYPSTNGTRDNTYATARKTEILNYINQGWQFGLDFGLHYAPGWCTSQTNGRPTDQNGQHPSSTTVADLVWNSTVRSQAASYIADVISYLNLTGNISYIAISGSGSAGEAVMPSPVGANGWWTGSPTALATVPSGWSGWDPGTALPAGKTTALLRTEWYEGWYHAQLVDYLTWFVTTVRATGYMNPILFKMPGTGTNLWVYRNRLALSGSTDAASPPLINRTYDGFSTMNSGAVYQLTIPAMAAIGDDGIWVSCSSLADHSGTPDDNQWVSSDQSISYPPAANSGNETTMDNWSGSRWQKYFATRAGLSMVGESTGGNDFAEMQTAVALARNTGLKVIFWAFDSELRDGSHATLAQYTSLM